MKLKTLVTFARKVVDFQRLALAVPIRLQNEATCTHDIFSTQSKKLSLKNELTDLHLEGVMKNSFQVYRRGVSPESPRSKFAAVGLWD